MSTQFENSAERSTELISLFLDGEDVDPGLLGKALIGPGGRDTLLEFLALRERLHRELDFRPSADFYETLEERLSSARPPTVTRKSGRMALATLSLLLGIGIGFGLRLAHTPAEDPPAASRTFYFELGTDWYAHADEQPTWTREEQR